MKTNILLIITVVFALMANEALQTSTKPEIKTLANAMIKAQEAEIKQMKEWQAAWSK